MKSEKVYFYSFQIFNINNARDVLFNGYGLVSYPNAVDAFKNIKGHIEKAVSSKHKRGLFIRDIATYGDNKTLNGYFSLMTSIHGNRSVFWRAYEFQKIKQLKKGRRLRK